MECNNSKSTWLLWNVKRRARTFFRSLSAVDARMFSSFGISLNWGEFPGRTQHFLVSLSQSNHIKHYALPKTQKAVACGREPFTRRDQRPLRFDNRPPSGLLGGTAGIQHFSDVKAKCGDGLFEQLVRTLHLNLQQLLCAATYLGPIPATPNAGAHHYQEWKPNRLNKQQPFPMGTAARSVCAFTIVSGCQRSGR